MISSGDSYGDEYGGVYLSGDNDFSATAQDEEDPFPIFEGVCFEYDNYFAPMSLEQAEIILQRSMDVVDFKSNYPEEYERFRTEGILIKNEPS